VLLCVNTNKHLNRFFLIFIVDIVRVCINGGSVFAVVVVVVVVELVVVVSSCSTVDVLP